VSRPVHWQGLITRLSNLVRRDFTNFNHDHSSAAQGGVLPLDLRSGFEDYYHDGSKVTLGRRYANCVTNTNLSSVFPTAARFYVQQWPVPRNATVLTSVGAQVATIGVDQARVSVYSDNGGYPKTQLYETADLNLNVGAVFVEETGLSVNIVGVRMLHLVYVCQTGAAKVFGPGVNNQPHHLGQNTVGSGSLSCFYYDGTYPTAGASFPSPATGLYTGVLPGVFATFA
jgi:hypothetical protein